jgi:Sigma-70 region 2
MAQGPVSDGVLHVTLRCACHGGGCAQRVAMPRAASRRDRWAIKASAGAVCVLLAGDLRPSWPPRGRVLQVAVTDALLVWILAEGRVRDVARTQEGQLPNLSVVEGASFALLGRGPASLRAWLYRIATNRCLNALRDRKSRPAPVISATAGLRARAVATHQRGRGGPSKQPRLSCPRDSGWWWRRADTPRGRGGGPREDQVVRDLCQLLPAMGA